MAAASFKPGEIIKYMGSELRYEKTVKGSECEHLLFSSVTGGWMVSFTDKLVASGELQGKISTRSKSAWA
ncbi:MAG: hypothetical protein RRY12_01415 [Cloacibacillus sp.]